MAPLLADMPTAEHHSHEMLEQAAATPVATGPEFFSQTDYATVSKLADLIIPRTDTPGAIDAGVPHWIDKQVAAKAALQDEFKKGLAALPPDFMTLSEARQIEILQGMSDDPFFKTVKDLTIDTYYKTEAGLVQELGFHGNTFCSSFPGCTHPEHWPSEDSK
jgi:hypothetical protein